jgi:hypothetical protein
MRRRGEHGDVRAGESANPSQVISVMVADDHESNGLAGTGASDLRDEIFRDPLAVLRSARGNRFETGRGRRHVEEDHDVRELDERNEEAPDLGDVHSGSDLARGRRGSPGSRGRGRGIGRGEIRRDLHHRGRVGTSGGEAIVGDFLEDPAADRDAVAGGRHAERRIRLPAEPLPRNDRIAESREVGRVFRRRDRPGMA